MILYIIEAPFYDILKTSLQTESEEEIRKAKELTHTLLSILKETATINNFWTDKAAERKRIEGMIDDEIRYSGIEGLSGKATELATELMKLAQNREADLR